MMDQRQLGVIESHSFGTQLESVRTSLRAIVPNPAELSTASRDVLLDQALALIPILRSHPACPALEVECALVCNLFQLQVSLREGNCDPNCVRPLLNAVLTNASDADIWKQAYHAVAEAFTPQETISASSSSVTSSEERHLMYKAQRDFGVMYVDVPSFYEAFFGSIPELETVAQDVFNKSTQGTRPLFQQQGWAGWSADAGRSRALSWLDHLVWQVRQFAQLSRPTTRKLIVQSGRHALNFWFVDDPKAIQTGNYQWPHILVPGVFKSNPDDDKAYKAHFELARYVRKIFLSQPTRRFVLAFTLCGSWMRLWEFDRLGGIASHRFDINKNGQRFVSTIFGFLWMDDEALGFDPTIVKTDRQQYIGVKHNEKAKRLVLDELIKPAGFIGRATDSWQSLGRNEEGKSPDRNNEGELLQEATALGITNVARHYSHKTVRVKAQDDDVVGNIRKGLDITQASNYRNEPLRNRIHRRIVLRHFRKPIYQASSRAALLRALEGCIQGHKSLYEKAGLLHRDISINNLMINEASEETSFSSFLIDLDHAVKADQTEANRTEASGAKEVAGTRPFIATGVLLGLHPCHTYTDDLESFFWVLFWICTHYDGNGQSRKTRFSDWINEEPSQLGVMKLRLASDSRYFIPEMNKWFTPYYKPLIPWVDKLRKVVFPSDRSWQREDETLYFRMKEILRDAQNCPLVTAD
ncbi:hypothetical protein F5Y14DRAFT_463577 [Nemania sp. NC0429]|nr:hypothetical protein F5Y14DRAFT_463577 [Nemania sp. NC0429]